MDVRLLLTRKKARRTEVAAPAHTTEFSTQTRIQEDPSRIATKNGMSQQGLGRSTAKITNPSKAVAEARTPNGLSASGSPYPDGG
jgi:membrane-bound lytic murein transglycosylase B